jgi:hypothetical protein
MRILKLFILLSIVLLGCKTEEPQTPPFVITKAASDVSTFSAKLNGEVTDEGFTAATDRGFVYSIKNANPSVSDTKIQSGYGKGEYQVMVDNLSLNTKYYFKAFATNTKGTAYGEVQNFTTSDYKTPTVTTDAPLNITHFSADLGGSVTDAGGLTITQRGICYGLNPNPSISDNKLIIGEGIGVFKVTLQNLKDISKYYVRAYAINSKGISYGNEQSFNTNKAPVTPRDNTTKLVEVVSKTGRIWMDRNLGATQSATSPTDEKAFGDYYQWGRGIDGHQLKNSGTTTSQNGINQTNNPNFIITYGDWVISQNDNFWQGIYGQNNPCPNGFRLPTEKEWDLERLSWTPNNPDGAFASPLKLTLTGYRDWRNGLFADIGSSAAYWSSTPSGKDKSIIFVVNKGYNLNYFSEQLRAFGHTCRCIKD